MSSERPSKTAVVRKKSERTGSGGDGEALRKERLLSAVLDNLPVAVFVKDASDGFKIILWNKKNAEITGIPEEEALGRTDYDLFIKETADFFRNIDRLVIGNGKLLDIPEEKVDSPTHGKVWLHTVKVPVMDPDKDRHLLIGICEDITERKMAQDALRKMGHHLSQKEKELLQVNETLKKANEELKATQLQLIQAEKMESVGRLAAGVAHEVKNPLALLLMGVEYMTGGIKPDDPNIPGVLNEMREGIARADSIIRGLVDFSSSRQLSLRPMELNAFVKRSLLLVKHELTRGNVKIVKKLAPELPKVLIDSAKMEQVMVNLLINAIHAMAQEPAGKLEVRTSTKLLTGSETVHDEGARSAYQLRPGDRVVVTEILDSGSGIPDDKIDKIFDPFFTTKATGVGTGLGLTVVKKIVDLHHGTLEIQNRQERGVRATITLKAHEEHEKDQEDG